MGDENSAQRTTTTTPDQKTYTEALKKYEDAVKGIGISGFSFWLGRESKVLKYRSLTGPEKLRLFDMINLIELFPDIRNVDKIQALWKDLLSINCLFSVRPENLTAEHATNFETRSRDIVKAFSALYLSKHVTPYMHCMMMHVSQFMTMHGAILQFTQQGLEKFNDLMTKDYFRSSSHKPGECFRQVLEKQNWLEFLRSLV